MDSLSKRDIEILKKQNRLNIGIRFFTILMYIFGLIAILAQVELIYIFVSISNHDMTSNWSADRPTLQMGVSIVIVIICLVAIRELAGRLEKNR